MSNKLPANSFNRRQKNEKKNVIDLKTKSFQVLKAEKKVNILKTTMKTHHDMYWIVNVIVFINNICCVKINEKQGSSFYN